MLRIGKKTPSQIVEHQVFSWQDMWWKSARERPTRWKNQTPRVTTTRMFSYVFSDNEDKTYQKLLLVLFSLGSLCGSPRIFMGPGEKLSLLAALGVYLAALPYFYARLLGHSWFSEDYLRESCDSLPKLAIFETHVISGKTHDISFKGCVWGAYNKDLFFLENPRQCTCGAPPHVWF